jgi:hypothetical protein
MNKNDFVTVLKTYRKNCFELDKASEKAAGKQIQARALLNEIEVFATRWFDEIEPTLRSTYSLEETILAKYRAPLGALLESVGGKPSKQVIRSNLAAILNGFHAEVVVPVQMREAILAKYPSLDLVLQHGQGLEVEYLKEAIDCARLDKRRAAIILGWCATVNRFQLYIEKNGFDKFNQATVQMSAIQAGRYKRFNKKYSVQNLSELRMGVLDSDLLWVLEFTGVIDGNQHERLEICFTMRNTSAHPGDAILTDENVLSFFSDIDVLVLSNPKFAV